MRFGVHWKQIKKNRGPVLIFRRSHHSIIVQLLKIFQIAAIAIHSGIQMKIICIFSLSYNF